MRSSWSVGMAAVLWSSVVFLPVASGAQGTLADFQRSATVSERLGGLTEGMFKLSGGPPGA